MTLKQKIKALARIHDKLTKRAHKMVAKCYEKIKWLGFPAAQVQEEKVIQLNDDLAPLDEVLF